MMTTAGSYPGKRRANGSLLQAQWIHSKIRQAAIVADRLKLGLPPLASRERVSACSAARVIMSSQQTAPEPTFETIITLVCWVLDSSRHSFKPNCTQPYCDCLLDKQPRAKVTVATAGVRTSPTLATHGLDTLLLKAYETFMLHNRLLSYKCFRALGSPSRHAARARPWYGGLWPLPGSKYGVNTSKQE